MNDFAGTDIAPSGASRQYCIRANGETSPSLTSTESRGRVVGTFFSRGDAAFLVVSGMAHRDPSLH